MAGAPFCNLRNFSNRGIQCLRYGACPSQQCPANHGQTKPVALALEQRRAKFGLKPMNAFRHCRLAAAHFFRSKTKLAELCGHNKIPKVPYVHDYRWEWS
jgi:hypothetical protein